MLSGVVAVCSLAGPAAQAQEASPEPSPEISPVEAPPEQSPRPSPSQSPSAQPTRTEPAAAEPAPYSEPPPEQPGASASAVPEPSPFPSPTASIPPEGILALGGRVVLPSYDPADVDQVAVPPPVIAPWPVPSRAAGALSPGAADGRRATDPARGSAGLAAGATAGLLLPPLLLTGALALRPVLLRRRMSVPAPPDLDEGT